MKGRWTQLTNLSYPGNFLQQDMRKPMAQLKKLPLPIPPCISLNNPPFFPCNTKASPRKKRNLFTASLLLTISVATEKAFATKPGNRWAEAVKSTHAV